MMVLKMTQMPKFTGLVRLVAHRVDFSRMT